MEAATMREGQGRSEMAQAYTSLRPTLEHLVRRTHSRVGFAVQEAELRSAAHLGFVEAVGRYDAARGVPFEAYARHRIVGAMMDELRERDHLSRPGRRRAKAVEGARRRLSHRLDRAPTSEEIAGAAGESLETFHRRSARALSSTTVFIDDAGPSGWAESVRCQAPDAFERLCDADRRERLAAALGALPERTRTMLALSYRDELSYREIGRRYGVTESRVCQILRQACRQLRSALEA